MHCDYKLLEFLALRLNRVFPDAQQYECYNALLPTDAIAGESSSRLGNHAEKKLGCRDKLAWICTHGSNAIARATWDSYERAPLEFLIRRQGMVAELLESADDAFQYFLGNAKEPLVKTFATNVGEAYLHDLAFEKAPNDGRAERARITAEIRLHELLANRADAESFMRTAKQFLAELLDWTLGGTDGQEAVDDVVTVAGGRARKPPKGTGELVLAVYEGTSQSALGLAHVDPQENEAAGFGYLFRAGIIERNVKIPRGPFIEEAVGAFDLPTPDVQITEDGKTIALTPVSKWHAIFDREDGNWKLYDLRSSNGTVLRRRMKNGTATYVIIGLGKANEHFFPEGFFSGLGNAVLLREIDHTLALRPGTGFSVLEEDDICLGFKIARREDALEIVPLEGAVILHVLASG